jgi:hypothetical protein
MGVADRDKFDEGSNSSSSISKVSAVIVGRRIAMFDHIKIEQFLQNGIAGTSTRGLHAATGECSSSPGVPLMVRETEFRSGLMCKAKPVTPAGANSGRSRQLGIR